MVFFVRITVNQSHLRPICKSTKFNPKIQRTIYLINFQQLRLHVPDFIRTVVVLIKKRTIICLSMFFHCLTSRDYLATRMFKSYMLFCQRCVSAILLSILLLSRHSNRLTTMILPTTLSKLQHI